jgi:hypothetical protein
MNRAELEVQAYVEARLLGVRLLTLRARVLTGVPASAHEGSVVGLSRLQTSKPKELSSIESHAGSGELGQAIVLLHQSSSELQELTAEQPRRASAKTRRQRRTTQRGPRT